MRQEEDKKLLKSIKENKREAFNSLFRKYYAQLTNFAHGFLKDRDLAEEAVQEMFINIWNQRNHLDINSSVLSYLYMSVRNTALNKIKSIQVRQKHENLYADEYLTESTSIPTADNNIEIKQLINRGIKQLPQKCMDIFLLSRNEGLTYQEIADYLEVSKKTVENQMGIAFKKLRQFLTPHIDKLFLLILTFLHILL